VTILYKSCLDEYFDLPYGNTALGGDGGEDAEMVEKRESEVRERRRKETDIKRETEDVGLGRRLATGGGTA